MSTDDTPGAAPQEPTTPAAPAPEAPAAPAPVAAASAAPTTGQQVSQGIDQAANTVQQAFSGVPADPNLPLHIVLAIFLPWLEMILQKQVMKGVAFLVTQFVLFGLFFLIITIPLAMLVGLLAMVDSIILALRRSKGETFGEWDFCWKPSPSHV